MSLVFVLLAIVLFTLFAILAVRRTKDAPDVDRAFADIRSLDIEAFRNLVDPEEDAFLRSRLSPSEFRRIKRTRARATLAYVNALSSASLQFARFGDVAQRSPDPDIAASGRQIANSAINLRLHTFEARVRLTLTAAFPTLPARPLRPLLEQYDRANYLMVRHNGLSRHEVRG
jgi:hypothetical protein